MGYTYEPPNSEAFMKALLVELEHEMPEVYESLKDAKCEIYVTSNFSRIRWDAYTTIVRFRIPKNKYKIAKKLEKNIKKQLIQICNKIMPPECGLDVVDVEFAPLLDEKYEINGKTIKLQSYLNFNEFSFPDDFYKDLVDEINKCYSVGAYSAVRISTRKLLENLLIDILIKKYPKDVDKYYNRSKGMHKNFSELIEVFTELKDEFKPLGVDMDKIKELLIKFRNRGNAHAHSIVVKVRKEDVDKDREDLEFLIKVLTQRIYLKL